MLRTIMPKKVIGGILIFLSFAAVTVSASVSEVASPIRGAALSTFDSPFRAASAQIRINGPKNAICSGVLITSRLVLTNAHCLSVCEGSGDRLRTKPVSKRTRIEVRFSIEGRDEFETDSRLVERFVVHPAFRFSENCGQLSATHDVPDLAVLRLAREVVSSRAPARMGIVGSSIRLTIASYGFHSFLSDESGRLNEAEAKILSAPLFPRSVIGELRNMISDHGDSGAGAFVGDRERGFLLVGVVSAKPQSVFENLVQMVRLSAYRNFLTLAFAELGETGPVYYTMPAQPGV